jgi:hypothetical protein
MVVLGVATATVMVVVGLGMFATASGTVPLAGAEPSQLVRTESGKVRCAILLGSVGCQYLPGFPQAPVCDTGNYHCDIANITPGGAFSWTGGNIPGAHPEDDTVLNYGQTYHILGWTVLPNEEGGTRVTNDGTGHGMFVSIDNVYSI